MQSFLKGLTYTGIFAVPFVLLILSSPLFFPYITGKNFAFRIIVEIITASWLLLALYDVKYRPKFSWISIAILAFLAIMFVANLLGEYPLKSFWSNFERMEGYVTLVHFFLYFLVTSTMLTVEKHWDRFFNVALVAGVLMSLYAIRQIIGAIEISQGGDWRVDGLLGNSSYLGVYMLFHMFIAAWMFLRTKNRSLQTLYGALFFLFAFILFQTGTRGAVLGLIGGSALSFTYLALLAPKGAAIKKWALGGLLLVVLSAGSVWLARDSEFVTGNPVLNRFANISLSAGETRFTIWGMALEGVKERPILGWGQGNFNYVFNKYYEPSLYNAELWYDRTHNIFLDWLIAGGILGFLAYFAVLFSALYYLLWRPFFFGDETFTVYERAALLGLLFAYMFHNLFVFDNLASWIFYAVILALIHSRVGLLIPTIQNLSIERGVFERVAVPSVAVATVALVYFVNVPGILASKDIIDAFKAQDIDKRLTEFQSALNRHSFAAQEINEQMAGQGSALTQNVALSQSEKLEYAALIESEFKKLIADKPGDARLHVIFANFYRFTNNPAKSLEQLNIAHELSPRKPHILIEMGFASIQAGNNDQALQYFKDAYALAPDFLEGRVYYAVGALLAGKNGLFAELADIGELEENPELLRAFAKEDMIVTAAHETNHYDFLKFILEERVKLAPEDAQARTNLAIAYYETGNTTRAVEILNQAVKDIPSFKKQGQEIIADMLSGKLETR